MEDTFYFWLVHLTKVMFLTKCQFGHLIKKYKVKKKVHQDN
jgi:hypothetical protein